MLTTHDSDHATLDGAPEISTVFDNLMAEIKACKDNHKRIAKPIQLKIIEFLDTSNMTINSFCERSKIAQTTIQRWRENLTTRRIVKPIVKKVEKKATKPLVKRKFPVADFNPMLDEKIIITKDKCTIEVPAYLVAYVMKQLTNSDILIKPLGS